MFQKKWPYCVLFSLSQLISHTSLAHLGVTLGLGEEKVVFCLFLAITVSHGISECHLTPSHLFYPGSEHELTIQVSPANPEFLDHSLVKFVGGDLAFPLSGGHAGNP